MSFDPAEHFLKLKGKDYLPVAWRLVWFRSEHPTWSIRTDVLEHDAEVGRALVKASVCDVPSEQAPYGFILAVGHKMETRKDFPDYLEKAETGAIGRALAALGYGTQFVLDELDESHRLVDAPAQGFVPTDVRDVEDNAWVVRSADDPAWKSWQKVLDQARGFNVKVQDIRMPIDRRDLKAYASGVIEEIKARRASVGA